MKTNNNHSYKQVARSNYICLNKKNSFKKSTKKNCSQNYNNNVNNINNYQQYSQKQQEPHNYRERGEKIVELFIYMSIKNTNSGKLIVIFK